MGKIFSVCNQKGGVGKTTTTVNLSVALAKYGLKVLLIDMDPQGNATSGLGINKNSVSGTTYELIVYNVNASQVIINDLDNYVSIIPANNNLAGAAIEIVPFKNREFLLRTKIEPLKEKYDFILIDCPPSLGLLTLNALATSDGLLIPIQCEYYALEGIVQVIEIYKLVRTKLNNNLEIAGVLMTMADFRTNLTQQVINEVRDYFKEKVFRTVIPRSVRVSEAPSFGKPVVTYDPQSKGARAYLEFSEEFVSRFAPEKKTGMHFIAKTGEQETGSVETADSRNS